MSLGSVPAEPAASTPAPAGHAKPSMKWIWLVVAAIAMIVVLLLPTPDALPVAGHRALAVLVFAIVIWVSEAVTYPVSGVIIVGLMALLIGFSPSLTRLTVPETGETPVVKTEGAELVEGATNQYFEQGPDDQGTNAGLRQAMGGFSNTAFTLVVAALMLSVAMQVTGLDRHIAFWVLKAVGERTSAVLAGVIAVCAILSFFVPSTTARMGALTPIIVGIIAAFGMAKDSRLGSMLMIAAVQATTIWSIAVKTGSAPNVVGIGLIRDAGLGELSWGKWLVMGAPWAIIMSLLLYFVVQKVIQPEVDHIEGGKGIIDQNLQELGGLTGAEKRLIAVAVGLLFFWATEDIVFPIDSSTITVVAIGILLLPRVGVMAWKDLEQHVSWGTIVIFGAGISLGSLLLSTGAAAWLSDAIFGGFGLESMGIVVIIAITAVANILLHLGFASATSYASALMPVFIALTLTVGMNTEQSLGYAVIMTYVVSFGFLLPINSPQGILAYGSRTFSSGDFLKVGIPLTVFGYILVVLFSATFWQWIGII